LDSEEKELLKKLLKKVEKLEVELEKRDTIIQRIQEDRQIKPKVKEHPEWGPLPDDPLARVIVQKAREKVVLNESTQGGSGSGGGKVTVEELRKNFSFGELARFAIKKRMLREGRESMRVKGKGQIKIYEDK